MRPCRMIAGLAGLLAVPAAGLAQVRTVPVYHCSAEDLEVQIRIEDGKWYSRKSDVDAWVQKCDTEDNSDGWQVSFDCFFQEDAYHLYHRVTTPDGLKLNIAETLRPKDLKLVTDYGVPMMPPSAASCRII